MEDDLGAAGLKLAGLRKRRLCQVEVDSVCGTHPWFAIVAIVIGSNGLYLQRDAVVYWLWTGMYSAQSTDQSMSQQCRAEDMHATEHRLRACAVSCPTWCCRRQESEHC